MNRTSITRPVFVPILALLLGGGTLVGSILDRDLQSSVHFDAPHDPSRCPDAHDHTLCTQLGADRWVAGTLSLSSPPAHTRVRRPPPPVAVAARAGRRLVHPPRAPPV